MILLYLEYRNYNGRDVNHFREVTKLIRAAKGAKRAIRDVELTRYGCYMLVLQF